MYLLYIDESGNPNSWQDQNHLVLGGVAVFEGEVRNLSLHLDQIQAKFLPTIAVPIEFHTGQIRTAKGRFGRLSDAQRVALLKELGDTFSRFAFPKCIAFSTSIHISAVSSPADAFKQVFEELCERFNLFLTNQFKAGFPSKGMLIIDRSPYSESLYRQMMTDFQKSGTVHGYLGNIVDIPYFAESHHTRPMQLADFVAHAVFRYHEANDATYFNQLFPYFHRKQRGGDPPDGFKHVFKASPPCSCKARH